MLTEEMPISVWERLSEGFSMERSTVESTALFPVVEAGLGQPIVLSAVPIMEILAGTHFKRPS